jgi:hypothetical protein
MNYHADALRFLIAKGVDLNATDKANKTALSYARSLKSEEKANPLYTPAERKEIEGNIDEIVGMLEKAGAK